VNDRGSGIVELLVGTALALVVLGSLAGAVGTGARLLGTAGARGEGEDTVALAVDAFTFDVRRAGFDPAATGVPALSLAAGDRLAVAADLDTDGTVDPASEETIAYACAAGRLSRIVGQQSMPLADGVLRCALSYLDAAGAELAVPPGGLAGPERERVRAVVLDVALRPPGLHGPTVRRALVALRSTP
jgi:hypothetical protein